MNRAQFLPAALTVAGLLAAGVVHFSPKLGRYLAPKAAQRFTEVPPLKAEEPKRADQPQEAVEFFRLKRLAPGMPELPMDRYRAAADHASRMPVYSTVQNRSYQPGENIPKLFGTWSALGPGNIGGRTRALLIHPTTPTTMIAAGVAGGIWRSTDSGASWTPVADLLGNIAVNSLAATPGNFNVLYAGTGEGYFNGDALRGNGIYKSTDGGLSWTVLANTQDNSNFHYVNDIVVSPVNASRVYAATRAGVFRSTDAGVTWTLVLSGSSVNGCLDLVIRTDQSTDYLFASCGTFVQSTIYRNTDAGGSGTWTAVYTETGMGRTSLALAPSNQAVIYALSASVASGNYDGGLHAVFRSTSSGASGTWTAQVRNTNATKLNTALLSNTVFMFYADCFGSGTNQFFNQGWYDNVIAVDPVDQNIVWAGGIDLFRSDDGGANWGMASHWWAATTNTHYVHADNHALVFHPQYNGSSNQVLFAGNDGGLFRTNNARATTATGPTAPCNANNGSVSWANLNNGYGVTQFYHGIPYPTGTTYFGGTQDNGTVRGTDGGANAWSTLLGGDGGYVAVDPGNTNILYAENTGNSIQKSTNGGTSFAAANSGITDDRFLFIAPFTMDPSNANTLWTGGRWIWRTTNAAVGWTRASADLTGTTAANVSALAVNPTNSNNVVVGLAGGAIHRSTTALSDTSTSTWPATTPRSGYVSWVAFDPITPTTVYATYATFGGSHVWKSTNGGQTFSAIDGSGANAIPDIPVHSIIVDPSNNSRLYIGTDIGVFSTTDGGVNWARENTGFANVITEALAVRNVSGTPNLFAFTHGRGVFRVTIPSSGTVPITVTSSPVGRSVTVDGSTFTAPQTFNWIAGSSHTIATTTPQAGSTGQQFVFANWSDGGAISHSITTPASATTYTANFNTQYQLTTSTNGTGTITINPTSSNGYYNQGTSVQLTANPTGTTFLNWSGSGTGSYSGTNNPATITMNGPITMTANFANGNFVDPLLSQQWHLTNATFGINPTTVWNTLRGAGMNIAIVDDGLQTAHPDLTQNVYPIASNNHFDFNGNDNDPNPNVAVDFHGTACAGAAAARGNNGIGVRGVAWEASLIGLRLIAAAVTDSQESSALNWLPNLTHVSSNSWGPSDNGTTLGGPGPLTLASLQSATTSGRGGKGIVFVWAGGNGRANNDNSNYDGYANSRFVNAIGAVTDAGAQAWYSESGANLVVVAPSSGGIAGITTTDLFGANGYDPTDYTSGFGGTSAAAPIAAGAAALVLQANPNLGWRDVKEILIRSASKSNLTGGDAFVTNGAGISFSHSFGAGRLNVGSAVTMATGWTNLGAETSRTLSQTGLNVSIPDNNAAGITRTFDMASLPALRVEHVELTVSVTHTWRGDLEFEITAPSGMKSFVSNRPNDSGSNYNNWTFSSVRHWGETSTGTWSVRIADRASFDVGTLTSITLTLRGTTPAAPVPDLTIGKTHTGNFTQGQTGATYTITVNNAGGGATSGTVTVTDTLPTGLTATAMAGTGWSCTVATRTCTRSDALAAGASYPVITLTVNVANNAPASVTNTVSVSGGGETNTANNTASDPTTVVQVPDLTISKTHTGNFTQGQTGATYTITVNNAGGGATSGTVTVTDTLPTGLTATAMAGTGWSCTLATRTCTRSDVLAAGASYPVITLTVNVANNAPASVTNTVSVSGGGETNTANNTATDPTTIVQLADLTISKTHTGNFTQGQVGATYSITVSNVGAGPTSGTVTVTDTLPTGLTATAMAGTGWNCTLATRTCTRSDAIAGGGSYPVITLTVNVASNAPASVTNNVAVSGGGEINTSNNSASDVTTIVSPNGAPSAVSVTPSGGSGLSQTFSFVFSDPNGFQDLDVVNVLLNKFLDGNNSCYLAYSRPLNVLYLVNDAGTALLPGLTLNGSGSVSNSQCTVNGSGSSAVGNGNTLTLTLNMSMSSAYAGSRIFYVAARDSVANNSGWQALGAWTIPGGTPTNPSVTSVTPSRVTTSAQTVTVNYNDTAGGTDLGVVNVLINAFLNGNNSCYLAYSRPQNVLYLVNDAGNALLPGMVLNGTGNLSNGQCTITGAGTTAVVSGNTLTLTLNLTMSQSYQGSKVIWAAARTMAEVNSGWQAMGTWTVP